MRLDGPVPFRGGGFAPRDRAWAAASTLVVLLLLWQAAASAGLIRTLFLPPPVAIGRALWSLTVSGVLWQNLSVSLLRLGVGWSVRSRKSPWCRCSSSGSALARAPRS